MKQFKSESKKLMNLMINSIYTNKDIYLREIISNASDAIDKLHYKSLTDKTIKLPKQLEINIKVDKENRTITISDNGIGMTDTELDKNLGTIAESDSELFKENIKESNVIGQFGVGFYSTFMVANKVEVISKSYKEDKSYIWSSEGIEGYTIKESNKENIGTDIIIYLKEDTEEFKYSEYLEEYKIKELISKYSNYINYPIKMEVTKKIDDKQTSEIEILNEMTPIWKKTKVEEKDYNNFYMDKFNDYKEPIKTIKYKQEGLCSFDALLFIPSIAPHNYYNKTYQKGLRLYSNGVLIMENCEELLKDHYSFVKGIIDSSDISLNISREILQQDKQLQSISKSIDKKINKELTTMLKENREQYEQFYKEFGIQLKVGIYNSYGTLKDELQDLLLFYQSKDKKMITLKEYVENILENQDTIYYAVGESLDKIDLLPQVEHIKEKGYNILYLTDYADEFVLQMIQSYQDKKFMNIENSDLDLDTIEEKEKIEKLNKDNEGLLNTITKSLNVSKVKFTNNLKNHPVCLITEGNVSTGMEKIINALPNEDKIEANKVLVINANHNITNKLEDVYKNNPDDLEKYAKVLYAQARLVEGLNIENTNEISDLVCELLSK